MSGKFFAVLLLLCWRVLWAQAQPGNYQIGISKDNLSWFWEGRLNLSTSLRSRGQFYLKNRFLSNLFRESVLDNKWKDENNLEGGWSILFRPHLKFSTHFISHIFSDENTFVKFSKHLLVERLEYQPRPEIRITPGLGYATEDIYSFRDRGWYSEFDVNVNDYQFYGYRNTTRAKSAWFFFPGRRNQEHKVFVAFRKEFSALASDSLQVGYEFRENAYHLAQTYDLENVEVNGRYLYNLLIYSLTRNARFDLETRMQNRDVFQENPNLQNWRKEFSLNNRLRYVYRGRTLETRLALLTGQLTNRATRSQTSGYLSTNNIQGLQTAFNIFLGWDLSPRDRLSSNFSYTKYEYASPDTAQHIDEDDLRFIGDVAYRHRFSDYFEGALHLNLYLYHQIYIHASRSGNNNWNRIYQMQPIFRLHIPGVLENTNSLKILANYTVYDFEEYLPKIRSYIYRKMIFSDSLALYLTPVMKLQLLYQLEKEDNGTFFKDVFAEQVSRELTSHFIDLSLIYSRLHRLKMITGWNWYIRKEWSHTPEFHQSRNYFAFSPRLTLMLSLTNRLMLHMTYAPKMYRDIDIPSRYYVTGYLRLKYVF